MAFPKPVTGQVIRYSYLWHKEHGEGREEGIKDRPCAVVLTTRTEDGDEIVTVLPITHRPPEDKRYAIEIPTLTKRRLGLDDDLSWIVLNEANRFVWPGPDLRPQRRKGPSSVVIGLLPAKFIREVRRRLAAVLREQRFKFVPRTK